MVRVSLVAVTLINVFFSAICYVSAKPSYKGPELSEISEDETLALIIGIDDHDVQKSEDDAPDVEEEEDKAIELLKLLLKGQNYQRDEKSAEKAEVEDVTAELKAKALRQGCYQAAQCHDTCQTKKKKKEKHSCKNVCQQIMDMCTTTTKDPCAKDDPCGGTKWGKTMPPKWRLLLRAIQQQNQ
ncbi:uncharacterized protein LOC128681126 [Plodia interpunctella]|uniref:uncharacterized protein LOC128681126 n=1 Tax=Plodia interpunctella TaxID=58824 RepID=UPI0023679328|nr:uncharacterized protein LOC128681126 [Plodia interpunctella]